MGYLIIAKFLKTSTPWCANENVIDSTDDLGYANQLVQDYKVAYGPWYKIYFRRKTC